MTKKDNALADMVGKTVYLSGPMRGIERFNFPAFRRASLWLRSIGIEVLSPQEHDEEMGYSDDFPESFESFDVEKALEWDLAAIIDSAGVVLLDGWQSSKGCEIELRVALATGKPIIEFETAHDISEHVRNFYNPQHYRGDGWGGQVMLREPEPHLVRQFDSGATRSSEDGKHDPEGFLDPAVLERFFVYMHKHRHLPDGSLRDSDNWQKGFGIDSIAKSLIRHFFDFWNLHRGNPVVRPEDGTEPDMEDTLMALLFNVMAYAREYHGNEA